MRHTLRQRLDRANQIRSLHNAGVSSKQIAVDRGISRARVYQLISYAETMDRLLASSLPDPPANPLELYDRPAWTYPDEITRRLVADTRREMESGNVPLFRDWQA